MICLPLLPKSGGSIGSYSAPYGIDHIRRHVAEYIERRDALPANWQNVFLSAGASTAIKYCLQLFSNDTHGKKNGRFRKLRYEVKFIVTHLIFVKKKVI